MSHYRFSFPTPIHFGPGIRAKLADFLKNEKLKRPLIVTDKGLAALPVYKEVNGLLEKGGLKVATFPGVFGNPVKSQVTEGVKAFKSHDADCIVGLGGGAALDVAKAIALMATHPGDLFDYEDEKPGARPINGPIPFWVAVPTTSGTGSEVGRSSVVSDDETHIKKIIFDPKLLARAVFADPELTLELPAGVTAATGMDALTHCVEAYLAKGYHPICDGVALEGLSQAARFLVRAVKSPKDIEARSGMMICSMMGAIAFQKGLGVTHSCAHALGTVADLHHGLANGVMIDFALKHNLSAVPERFKAMATTVELVDPLAAKMKISGSPEGFLKWLTELKRETGIPAKLSGVKIGARDAGALASFFKEKLDRLVEIATADACHPNNPRVCSSEDFRRIFSEAF